MSQKPTALTHGWFKLPHPTVAARWQGYGPIEADHLFGWNDLSWIDHGCIRFFRDGSPA